MDAEIFLFFNQHYCDFLDGVMPWVTHRFVWIAMYVAIAYSVVASLGMKRGLMFIAAIGVAILLADHVGASAIRPWVARLRPSNPDSPLAGIVHIVNGYRGGPYGMPSCHAANTVCLMTMLMMRFRLRAMSGIMMVWVALQVYSRMYLGVHYPGDLLAGAALGALSAVAVTMGYRRLCAEDSVRVVLQRAWVPASVFALTLVACLAFGVWL